jgi:valyl-tRNA synthetase
VRYWAACGRPGVDTAFDEGQMKTGRKLANKLLNSSKFVLGFPEPDADARPTMPFDLAMLAGLDTLVEEATVAFDRFDYARALERTESFFWWFCDDYIEVVKDRAYGAGGDEGASSARASLRMALGTLHRLFAPFLPFVTDEVWSWWQEGSVHRQSWPTPTVLGGDATLLGLLSEVVGAVRRTKSEAKLSAKAAVSTLVVHADASTLERLRTAEGDIMRVGSVETLRWEVDTDPTIRCEVTLAPVTAD